MNYIQYRERINLLLEELKKEMPVTNRLALIEELEELLSAFLVD